MGVQQSDADLNRLILEGKALDGFEKYYAEHCVMQENSEPPTEGKAANRQREIDFFDSLAEVHEVKLVGSAVGDDISFSEWIFDVTLKGGGRKRLEQAAVRRWREGQIVRERFYYNAA